mgnify:CR=1 FL=1
MYNDYKYENRLSQSISKIGNSNIIPKYNINANENRNSYYLSSNEHPPIKPNSYYLSEKNNRKRSESSEKNNQKRRYSEKKVNNYNYFDDDKYKRIFNSSETKMILYANMGNMQINKKGGQRNIFNNYENDEITKLLLDKAKYKNSKENNKNKFLNENGNKSKKYYLRNQSADPKNIRNKMNLNNRNENNMGMGNNEKYRNQFFNEEIKRGKNQIQNNNNNNNNISWHNLNKNVKGINNDNKNVNLFKKNHAKNNNNINNINKNNNFLVSNNNNNYNLMNFNKNNNPIGIFNNINQNNFYNNNNYKNGIYNNINLNNNNFYNNFNGNSYNNFYNNNFNNFNNFNNNMQNINNNNFLPALFYNFNNNMNLMQNNNFYNQMRINNFIQSNNNFISHKRSNSLDKVLYNNKNLYYNNLISSNKKIKLKEPKFKVIIKSPSAKGLENIGATCYMNATLQCLAHIEYLTKYLLDNISEKNNKYKLTNAYTEVLYNLWQNKNINYYTPTHFKDIISKMNSLFAGIQANDSKDLVLFLLENIHNELNKPNNNYHPKKNSFSDQYNYELTFKLFSEYFMETYNSVISHLFYGMYNSMMKCSNCNVTTNNVQCFNILIFPLEEVRKFKNRVNNQVDIEECFEFYQKYDYMTGDNQIFCNNCNKMSDCCNYTRLIICPNVLVINLNRGKGLQFDVKLNFGEYLNIQEFIYYKNDSPTYYELTGIVTHFGPSSMSGHFIAFCKSFVDHQWYKYNDAQVDLSSFREANSTGIPYILFYSKK